MLIIDKTEPAIRRAIKLVAVGKKGSKPLDTELIRELLTDFKEGRISPLSQGAFLGALFVKGITEEEKLLESAFKPGTLFDPQRLVEAIAPEAPFFIKNCCVSLLKGETLDKSIAYQLGKFLFINPSADRTIGHEPGDALRGLTASVLRVRYETIDEYEGLLQSIHETIEPIFREDIPDGDPIIQLAEPFDGVDQSNMITPLVAGSLQRLGYRVVSQVGRNSGPKFGNNLLDIAQKLNAKFLKNSSELRVTSSVPTFLTTKTLNTDEVGTVPASSSIALKFKESRNELTRNSELETRNLDEQKNTFGWYINQADLSRPMDHWVDLRRQIIKRPFLATIERFVNPLKASIVIASAFHPPYGEKMISIGERAGFPGIVIVRNGVEGTMAFALKRPVKILCSARQKDQTFKRHEFEFQSEEYLGKTFNIEEKVPNPSLDENVRLIEAFAREGKTLNELFDARAKVTCEGLRQAVEWINIYQRR